MIELSGHVKITNSYRAREDFRELSLSNGFCRSSLQIVGNKIIHHQRGKHEIQYVREFSPTQLVLTITVDKAVTMTKYYRATDGIIMNMH
jgi:hypothetical protein